MKKKFFEVSLGIFMFLFISLLGFKFLYGDRKIYSDGSIKVPEASIKYSGFEEDENNYKIKVSIKNNSKYYGSLRDIKLKFQNYSWNVTSTNSGPTFGGYKLVERESFENYEEERKEYSSPFFNPSEEKLYVFEIPKGLSFDENVFDTNRMGIYYSIEYFKYRPKENAVSVNINMEGSVKFIDNSIEPYEIK
ncbi:hypothetical protein [Clostridium sp.]|uniref:hypothetical protein n=1 Tax=Clostridium sp. TaxID=1506 RepID=UPI0029145D3E|nr:hypothetical protein [Clostridium sp.]MDU5106824.1 hypothetical protein [Clostridium sp.]